MRKIAIITTLDYGYDDYNKVIESITDWSEVTDEQYKVLYKHRTTLGNYDIIERLDSKEFIQNTIASYLQHCAKEEIRIAEEKKKQEQRRIAAELKEKAKKESDEIAMLLELHKKHPNKVKITF